MTNKSDTQNTEFKISNKSNKTNDLSDKNTTEEISANTTQTNSDDTNVANNIAQSNLQHSTKPEVGDVWVNTENKAKFVILDYNPTSKDFIGFNQQTKNMRLFDALDDMPKQFKYLGKSEANIKRLFNIGEFNNG